MEFTTKVPLFPTNANGSFSIVGQLQGGFLPPPPYVNEIVSLTSRLS
jgi:hypothetical protein